MKVPVSRKAAAPKNVAAKSLRLGQFQPKVEEKPGAYKRRKKHPEAPGAGERDEKDDE